MVGHHVHHDPNVPVVALPHQVPQVLLRPEPRVELVDVLRPVAVVAVLDVEHDGADPEGVHAQRLQVVQLGDHAPVVAAAVLAQGRAVLRGVDFSCINGKKTFVFNYNTCSFMHDKLIRIIMSFVNKKNHAT